MVAMRAAQVAPTEWVSIGRACQILGVNAATLRQWTTDGRLRSYRTPGGHRRFSLAELTALSQSGDAPPEELTDTLIGQLRSRYRGMARSSHSQQGWWQSLPTPLRERFHELGEEVLVKLGAALSARSLRERQRAASEGRDIGVRYAALAREAGVDTAQGVEAYLAFRRPLLDVLARALAAHPALGEQLGRLMREAERFMDEVLAGLTGANGASETKSLVPRRSEPSATHPHALTGAEA
jgi:excisionase family DNA binding protein